MAQLPDEEATQRIRAAIEATRARRTDQHLSTSEPRAYDLTAPAKVIYPVTTPLRNMLPRTQGTGNDQTQWESVTAFALNTLQPGIHQVEYSSVDLTATYDLVSSVPEAELGVWEKQPRASLDDELTRQMAELLYAFMGIEEAYLVGRLIATARENAADDTHGGATVRRVVDARGGLAIPDVDDLLAVANLQTGCDPDFLLMHPGTHTLLSFLERTQRSGRTLRTYDGHAATALLTVDYRPTHWENPVTGKLIPIMVDRYCPGNVIIGFTMSLPYPVPRPSLSDPHEERTVGIEVECNQDYLGFTFGNDAGDVGECQIMSDEVMKVYWLGGLCLLEGIGVIQ